MPNLSLQFFNPTILPQLLWSPRNQVRNLRKTSVIYITQCVCIMTIMMQPKYIAKTIKTIGSRIHIVKPLGPRIHNLSHCARNHSWQAPHQTDRLNQPHVTPVQCFFALVAHPASKFLFWSCTARLAKPNKNVKSNESAIEQKKLLKKTEISASVKF